jgi:3-oxoadipate enol-lactonase
METFLLSRSSLAIYHVGRGTPLVLVHGYPLDHRIWVKIIPWLEKDFELILPDLPGFGQSKSPDAEFSLSDMADDLAELLDLLGLHQVVMAGHSMGGYVALAFARSYPDRLLGLGLIASQTNSDTPEKRESRYLSLLQVEQSGVGVIADGMAGKLTSDPQLQAELHEIIMSQPEAGIKNAIKALAERPDQNSLLDTFQAPLLVVHGDSDELIPVERAVEVSESAANTKLVIIPKIGHMPMLEAPEKTAAAIHWFKSI